MAVTLIRADRNAADTIRARRARVDDLLDLARHLAPADRALVEQVFRRGAKAAEVARLTGHSPRTLQKRLRGLLRHMRSPLFRLLAERPQLVPPASRAVAEAVVFRRETLRRAAAHTGLSLHQVRQHMLAVRTLARF